LELDRLLCEKHYGRYNWGKVAMEANAVMGFYPYMNLQEEISEQLLPLETKWKRSHRLGR